MELRKGIRRWPRSVAPPRQWHGRLRPGRGSPCSRRPRWATGPTRFTRRSAPTGLRRQRAYRLVVQSYDQAEWAPFPARTRVRSAASSARSRPTSFARGAGRTCWSFDEARQRGEPSAAGRRVDRGRRAGPRVRRPHGAPAPGSMYGVVRRAVEAGRRADQPRPRRGSEPTAHGRRSARALGPVGADVAHAALEVARVARR